MSGNREGGLKAAATNKKKHGLDFFKRIGRKGGKNGHTGGFAYNKALASLAGAKGGRNGKRRGPTIKNRATIRFEFPDGTFAEYKVSPDYAMGRELQLMDLANAYPEIVRRSRESTLPAIYTNKNAKRYEYKEAK